MSNTTYDTRTPAPSPSSADAVSAGARGHTSVAGIEGYEAQAAALRPAVQLSPAAAPASPRAVYDAYRAWIILRLVELMGMSGQEKLNQARGLLWQMEDLTLRLRRENVDISRLNTRPTAGAPQNCGGVPPEWIEPARSIISILENTIEGVNLTSAHQRVEGSVYADEDWNSRLGVPQYRTQSDNLASPEATCNGTSFAMAIERIGVGRADVVAACDRAMALTAESTPEQINEKWQTKVGEYLTAENSRDHNYQRLRGATQTQSTRNVMATGFRSNAQMEDVVLFLAWLHGISRTSITSSPENVQTLLTSIDGTDGANLATVEKITTMGTWDQLKVRIQTTLNGGGGVIFSFYHKGNAAGQSGKTHIITVQQCLDDGFIVDDPYGQVRTDYSHDEYGDAYAAAGSMTRTTKNTVESATDDWQVSRAQSPTGDETRGRSYKMTRKTIEESFYYVQLLNRA